MRIWSLLALPLLTACAVAGPVGSPSPSVLGASQLGGAGMPAAPSVSTGDLGHQSFGILLNDTRGGYNVLPVVENDLLHQAASLHAQDMVTNTYLSHTSLDGSSVGDRVLAVGYDFSFVAENIARGFSSQDAVVDAWMASPGHRSNMLDPRAVEFGIAQENTTWVLLLGAQ